MLCIVLCAVILLSITGCKETDVDPSPMPTPTVEPTSTPTTAPSPISSPTPTPTPKMSDEERIARMAMGSELQREAMTLGFGGIGVDDMVSTFGEPDRIADDLMGDFGNTITRWYYDDEGFEIDYTTVSDNPVFENYIYLGPSCKVNFCRGIIPGSTREELEKAYEEEIDHYSSTTEFVCAGYKFSYGVVFVMKDDAVDSIYISIGRGSKEYINSQGEFVPDR